ncbi:transporter substrate-binding domain-containing protein [Paramicrobacterium chengjingii]|uniref:transporter substrate-binding domain-containing protein n=1 Tax=Paramicrobacterium chengjingii TaxID=2769067 RepID=UPI00141F75FB|nr:transporter substrate-binding domain-containing protein [Microbacterium chengjingii]
MKTKKSRRLHGSLSAGAAILALFTVTACSSGESTDQDSLEAALADGVLTVGVKFDTRPFGYIPEGQSSVAGFDVDLAAAAADELGVEVEFVQVNSQNRILNLNSGKVDVLMASMLRTPERDESIDFSIDYFSDGQSLLVPEGSEIKSINDLGPESTVAVVQGTPEEQTLLEKAPEGTSTVTYQSWPDALQSLYRGEAEAVTTTVGILYGLKVSSDAAGQPVEIVGEPFADGPIAAGFRDGDVEFVDAFNGALLDLQDNGTYEEIYLKWWSKALPDVYKITES